MNYPTFNIRHMRPWVKKHPYIARAVAALSIVPMIVTTLLASLWGGVVELYNTVLPALGEAVVDHFKLAFYKWEEK